MLLIPTFYFVTCSDVPQLFVIAHIAVRLLALAVVASSTVNQSNSDIQNVRSGQHVRSECQVLSGHTGAAVAPMT